MSDEWRDIRGYESSYQVSATGQVRSLKRGKLLAPAMNKSGYIQLNLYRFGEVKHFFMHRLVADAFIGPIPQGMWVNHKDGDRTNNHLENLEIVTPKENNEHARRMGLIPLMSPVAKLTEDEVREIRRLKGKVRAVVLAERFAVSVRTIYWIWSGRTWKRVA